MFMQVRKLEFLLSDAQQQGCDTVITFGGLQSNHARATAIAARELGMETYIFVLNFTPEVSYFCFSYAYQESNQ